MGYVTDARIENVYNSYKKFTEQSSFVIVAFSICLSASMPFKTMDERTKERELLMLGQLLMFGAKCTDGTVK